MANDETGDRAINGWTAKTIHVLLEEIDKRYEQQFSSQTEALLAADKRYGERFEAQETAGRVALDAQKELVAQALAAQKEATSKAETAADKRFEAFSTALTAKLDALISARDTTMGKGLGISSAWAVVLGVVGMMAGASSITYLIIRISQGH